MTLEMRDTFCFSSATLESQSGALGQMAHPRSGLQVVFWGLVQSFHPKFGLLGWSVRSLTLLALLLPLAKPAAAQRVLDGLPPAPLPPAQPYGVPGSSPSVSVPPPTTAYPTEPMGTVMPAISSYIVVVDGDSPLLLSQVQQVEPGATIVPLEGRSLIQAGVFSDEIAASEQVQRLGDRGITSRIVAAAPLAEPAPVAEAAPAPQNVAQASGNEVEGFPIPELPTTVVPQEIEFESLAPLEEEPASSNPRSAQDNERESNRDYYIVIPAPEDDLADISEQVVRMAYGFRLTRLVEERDSRLGPHVRVGPFAGRGAAERWNNYFRDFGMDARVYYRR